MEEKLKWIEKVLEIEEGTLAFEQELESLEEWDSINKLTLLVEAKKDFQITFSIESIIGFKTIEDICKSLM